MSDANEQRDRQDDGVHRLRDIVVEEVSLVDRAANKRRFLVVKRSSEMADERTREDDDTESDADAPNPKKDGGGGKKKRTKTVARTKASAKTSPAEEAEGDEEDTTAEEADESDDEKTPPKTKKQDGEGADPGPLLQTVTDALEQLMNVASALKDAMDSEEGVVSADLLAEIADVAERLAEAVESEGTEAEAEGDAEKQEKRVAKAGARMARTRLDRFEKAIELLSGVLTELTNAKDAAGSGAPKKGVTKRDATSALPAGVGALATEIRELTRVVKRQDEELSRMRQTRGVSNAIPVDGGRRTEPQDVSWPFDMNRPITRDRVRKEVSFFDE